MREYAVGMAALKIRVMLAIVFICVKERCKLCIWVLLPAEQLLLWDILRKLQIDARIYSSDLKLGERQKLIQEFNFSEKVEKAQVLITSFSMTLYGLDL